MLQKDTKKHSGLLGQPLDAKKRVVNYIYEKKRIIEVFHISIGGFLVLVEDKLYGMLFLFVRGTADHHIEYVGFSPGGM